MSTDNETQPRRGRGRPRKTQPPHEEAPGVSTQAGLTDVILPDPEGIILNAIEKKLENRGAAGAYRKAAEAIKKALPDVTEPTRFQVAERFVITASPYEAEGHEIPGGRRLRLKITEL